VKTGKVSVSSQETSSKSRQGKTEIILTPNQQVTFDPHKDSLVASFVEKPLPLLNPDKIRNQYDEEPISNILSDIEKLYGIEISYDANILRNCRITTAFKNEGLDLRMDILMKAIGGTYTIEGTQIFVHSNGCQIN
jgi:transmembrane sensor